MSDCRFGVSPVKYPDPDKIHLYFCDRFPLKLWTEICEIRQLLKGDLLKLFCEIFYKNHFEAPPRIINSLYFNV